MRHVALYLFFVAVLAGGGAVYAQVAAAIPAACRQYSMARTGISSSCFLRVKRSSCAAATISPSRTNAAAESW